MFAGRVAIFASVGVMGPGRCVVVVLGALAALLPAPAWGDTIVFRRGVTCG